MAETQHSVNSSEHQGHRHEQYEVRILPFLFSLAGFGGLAIISLLLMWWLLDYLTAEQPQFDISASPLAEEARQLPPEPRLQVNPAQDWQELYAAQQTELRSYGWVDQGAGIVRVPIDRAIELLAEGRLPARREEILE